MLFLLALNNNNKKQTYVVNIHEKDIYVIHREVRIGKNCAPGLEYGPRPATLGRTQDLGHSFSLYGPT